MLSIIDLSGKRGKGLSVIVDDEDFAWLSQYKWHYDRGYAAMTLRKQGRAQGILYMHRMVNKTPKNMSTDHVNGDKLDNRRANLRTCNQTQNNANSKLRAANTSGHKGVTWHKKAQKWQAQIGVKGKCVYLGQFTEKQRAIEAYIRAATEHFGEFANVNL